MAASRKISVIPGPGSNKEFEKLLRRAAEYARSERPQLLKKPVPAVGKRAS